MTIEIYVVAQTESTTGTVRLGTSVVLDKPPTARDLTKRIPERLAERLKTERPDVILTAGFVITFFKIIEE